MLLWTIGCSMGTYVENMYSVSLNRERDETICLVAGRGVLTVDQNVRSF